MRTIKKLIFILFIACLSLTKADAQMYHPYYAYYVGYGTMYFTDYWGNVMCMYQGYISYGRPHGNGYAIWVDGSFYNGAFYNGFCHGSGVVGNYYGYIAGTWNMGNFVGVNNNYNNHNYNSTVQDVQSQYQQQSSNQNKIAMIDPDGYRIEKLDVNSEMGKALLGKIGSSSSSNLSTAVTNKSSSSSASATSGKIEKVWLEYNVYKSGKKGMNIHVKFSVAGMLNRQGRCVAWFCFADGTQLKDYNGSYRSSDNQVSTSETFRSTYEDSIWKDFSFFMPYTELHLNAGYHNLKFFVGLFDHNGNQMATSDYVSFSLTN